VLPLILLAPIASGLRVSVGAIVVVLILLLPYRWVVIAQPLAVLALMFLLVSGRGVLQSLPFALHLLAFYLTARVCHGELARDRPDSKQVTEFYLWLALGGAIGGLATALLAPVLFQTDLLEYPLALVLGCALRPAWLRNGVSDGLWALVSDLKKRRRSGSACDRDRLAKVFDLLVGAVGLAVTLTAFTRADTDTTQLADPGRAALYALTPGLLFCLVVLARPLRFALTLSALMVVHALAAGQPYLYASRSYLGMLKVQEVLVDLPRGSSENHRVRAHMLIHGSTQHGMSFLDMPGEAIDLRRLPASYFHPDGPVGQVLKRILGSSGNAGAWWYGGARLPASLVGSSALSAGAVPLPVGALVAVWSEPPMGIVGLGTGTLAAYGRPYQHLHFFEIDPYVIELSLPPPGKRGYFYFLEDSLRRGVHVQVVCGDGRLALHRQGPERFYKVLFLDAFNSSAVPTHLLTREAVRMYFQKLTGDGVLCVNVTNRHLDLAPVVAAVARDLGYCCVCARDSVKEPGHYPSDWVIVARAPNDLPGAAPVPGQSWGVPQAASRTWTDAFADVASALKTRASPGFFEP
jgi:spermidine synthase